MCCGWVCRCGQARVRGTGLPFDMHLQAGLMIFWIPTGGRQATTNTSRPIQEFPEALFRTVLASHWKGPQRNCWAVSLSTWKPPRPAPTQLCHLPAPLARGRAASWSDDTDVSQAPRCVGTREISPTAGKARFTWSLKVYVDREMGMLGPLLSVTRLRSRCQPGCDHLGSGAALSQAPLGCCQESAPCGCRTEVPGSGWLPAPSPCHHYLHSPPRASHSEAAFFFQASKRNSAAAVDFFFFT